MIPQTPPIITGDTLWDNKKQGIYHIPEVIDLSKTKFGYRNRDDMRQVDSDGFIFGVLNKSQTPIMNSNDKNIKDNDMYIGIDPDGNIAADYGKNLRGSNKRLTFMHSHENVTGFAKDDKNNYKLQPLPGAATGYGSPIFTKEDGTIGGIPGTLMRDQKDANKYGNISGGHMIISTPDLKKQVIVSGSVKDLDNQLEKFKKDNNVSKVTILQTDNGSFSKDYRTTSGKMTRDQWIDLQKRNNKGASGFYLKGRGYAEGGVITDPMGQWAHPGSITRIPSNNITMRGVDYPVLGVSDSGHKQMMYPGQDYKFHGKSVTEYPIMQKGGTRPPIYVNDLNDPRLKAYNDSSFLSNNSKTVQDFYKNKGYTLSKSNYVPSNYIEEANTAMADLKNRFNLYKKETSRTFGNNIKVPFLITDEGKMRAQDDSNILERMTMGDEWLTGRADYNNAASKYINRLIKYKDYTPLLDMYNSGYVEENAPVQFLSSTIKPTGRYTITGNNQKVRKGNYDEIYSYDPEKLKPVQSYFYGKPIDKTNNIKTSLISNSKSNKILSVNTTKVNKQPEQYRHITPGQLQPIEHGLPINNPPQYINPNQSMIQQGRGYDDMDGNSVYGYDNAYLGNPVNVNGQIRLRDRNTGSYIGNPISREDYNQYGTNSSTLREQFLPKQKRGGWLEHYN